MPLRKFDFTIVSADNLPKVRCLGRMKVYAVVLIEGKSSTTKVDTEGNRNPRWNETFEYMIDESCTRKKGSFLVVKLYRKRRWGRRDKLIGDDVRIEVKSLYDGNENVVTYKLSKTEAGTLTISFKFGKVFEPKKSAWKKNLCCLMDCVSMGANLVAL